MPALPSWLFLLDRKFSWRIGSASSASNARCRRGRGQDEGVIYQEIHIDRLENTGTEPAQFDGIIRLNPGARIIASRVLGPVFLNRLSQIGPDVVVGKYFGMNENCFVARATVGAFCATARAPRSTRSTTPSIGSASTNFNTARTRSTGSRNTTRSSG